MLKFLFMGDRHNSESIPKSRIDDYLASCKAKDEEIIDLAKKHNVAAILHPGDFWTDSDRKIGNEFIASIARRWMMAGIPIIGIAGNHDLIGNNEGSLPSTTTGLLNSLGIFKVISTGDEIHFSDGDNDIVITGTGYHKGMDKKEFLSDYIVNEKRGDVHLHLVHGMLTPKSLGKIIRHTTIDEIKDTKADVTLCGHDHIGFGIINYKDKYFVNPGAVVRMTCDVKEIARTVQVVLITIDSGQIEIEAIPLSSQKPGEEVLSRELIDQQKEKIQYQEFVKNGVEKLNVGNSLTVSDVLEEIYEEDNIPEHVRKSIESKIIEKKFNVKDKALSAPVDTDIVKIEIHNFQSHADTVVEFDRKFNVIVGESHQGKSAILRAIRWVAEGKPSGKGIIRIGQTEAYVELTLKNSTIIRKFISAKENGYKVYLPNGEVMEGNTRMVPQIQAILGWNNMPIGENEDIPLNHLRQGDSWYLIGDKYTPTDRARILGAINRTEGADAAIKDFDRENSRITDAIKREEIEVVNLVEEIKTAETKKANAIAIRDVLLKAKLAQRIQEYLAIREDYFQKADTLRSIEQAFNEEHTRELIKRAKDVIDLEKKVVGYMSTIQTERARLDSISGSLQQLESINETAEKSASVARKIEDLHRIETLVASRDKAAKTFKRASEVEIAMSKIDEKSTTRVRDKINQIEILSRSIETISKAGRTIRIANQVIESSASIDHFSVYETALKEKFRRVEQILDLERKKSELEQEVKTREQKQIQSDIDYNAAVQNKLDILRESHICPTCYSTINDTIIESIIEKENHHD